MARATPNSNINTAMATIVTNVATHLSAGGNADLLVRWTLAQLALADPALARAVVRAGVPMSKLKRLQGLSLSAADTLPA